MLKKDFSVSQWILILGLVFILAAFFDLYLVFYHSESSYWYWRRIGSAVILLILGGFSFSLSYFISIISPRIGSCMNKYLKTDDINSAESDTDGTEPDIKIDDN